MIENAARDKYTEKKNLYWQKYSYLIFLVFFLLLFLIFERNYFQKIEVLIRSNLREQRTLEAELLEKKIEERILFRPERVENISKKQFNMIVPTTDKVLDLITNE